LAASVEHSRIAAARQRNQRRLLCLQLCHAAGCYVEGPLMCLIRLHNTGKKGLKLATEDTRRAAAAPTAAASGGGQNTTIVERDR